MRHRRRKFLPPPPPPPDGSGERALAASKARLDEARKHVERPLREYRDANNVTALVTVLLAKGRRRDQRPAPG